MLENPFLLGAKLGRRVSSVKMCSLEENLRLQLGQMWVVGKEQQRWRWGVSPARVSSLALPELPLCLWVRSWPSLLSVYSSMLDGHHLSLPSLQPSHRFCGHFGPLGPPHSQLKCGAGALAIEGATSGPFRVRSWTRVAQGSEHQALFSSVALLLPPGRLTHGKSHSLICLQSASGLSVSLSLLKSLKFKSSPLWKCSNVQKEFSALVSCFPSPAGIFVKQIPDIIS